MQIQKFFCLNIVWLVKHSIKRVCLIYKNKLKIIIDIYQTFSALIYRKDRNENEELMIYVFFCLCNLFFFSMENISLIRNTGCLGPTQYWRPILTRF